MDHGEEQGTIYVWVPGKIAHFVAQGSSKLGYAFSQKIIPGYGLQDCTWNADYIN